MSEQHWEHYTIYKVDPNGMQRLLTEYISETHYTYIPARLPGNPRAGDRVSLFFPSKKAVQYTRCAVGEREYIALHSGWEPAESEARGE